VPKEECKTVPGAKKRFNLGGFFLPVTLEEGREKKDLRSPPNVGGKLINALGMWECSSR